VRSRLTTMVWLGIALIWAALLAGGAVWIRRHPAAPASRSDVSVTGCVDAQGKRLTAGFAAKRAFEVNHRIGEADLDWSAPAHGAQKAAFLGRYSACPIQPAERVSVEEVRLLPAIAHSAGHIPHPLPLRDPRLVDSLNAGSVVDVLDGVQPLARGVKVLAVRCGSGMPPPADSCYAILDAPQDDAARLKNANTAAIDVMVMAPKP
jgi:hypothetical protein